MRGQQGIDFITRGSAFMDYGFVFWPGAIGSNVNASMMDLFILTTLILTAPIHCRGSSGVNAKFLQIFSDEEKKSSSS